MYVHGVSCAGNVVCDWTTDSCSRLNHVLLWRSFLILLLTEYVIQVRIILHTYMRVQVWHEKRTCLRAILSACKVCCVIVLKSIAHKWCKFLLNRPTHTHMHTLTCTHSHAHTHMNFKAISLCYWITAQLLKTKAYADVGVLLLREDAIQNEYTCIARAGVARVRWRVGR